MKRQVIVLLLLMLGATLHAADWFDAYTQGDYAKARGLLEQELAARPFDPLSHYNLGVVAEKEGKRGEALFHYLQALQAAPQFTEARNNLDLLTGDLGVTIPARLTNGHGGFTLIVVLFFVALYLFIIVLVWHLVRPDWRRRLALVPLFMFLILLAFLLASRYREHTGEQYVVVLTQQTLRSGPDDALSPVGAVREGEIAVVAGASGGWVKVRSFQDNVEGWVAAPHVRYLTRRIE